MTSYEFECALVYLAEQIIKTFGKDVGVRVSTDGEDINALSKEPLIKDKEENALVKYWSKTYAITKVNVYKHESIGMMDLVDAEYSCSAITISSYIDVQNGTYSITELCGEGK